MSLPDPDTVPRREFCKAAVALGGIAGLSACLDADGDEGDETAALSGVPAGDPDTVPARQHAWNDVLERDEDGNVVAPTHHVLRGLSVSPDLAAAIENSDTAAVSDARDRFSEALTDIEHAFEWSNEGLLFTVGYAPGYFDRFDHGHDGPAGVDLPEPVALTSLEDPEFDTADVLVHLASDSPEAVLAAEEALFGEESAANGEPITDVTDLFEPVDRRTGFLGPGLPREHRDVQGVPDDAPIPEEAPLFIGFKNGFAGSQAPEDRVTIAGGPFAGGTTEHVSTLQTQLNAWWDQENHSQRVKKMFSPTHADEERVGEWGEKLGSTPGVVDLPEDAVEFAREEGVVGHAQKAARARDDDGTPPLLRRDFPTTDDDHTGLHFLTLQESIADFVRVREAMTGADLAGESGVGSRLNNGILQYVFVRRRGNYLVPPRSHRSLPDPQP